MIKYQIAKTNQASEIKNLLKISWDKTYINNYPQEVIDKITAEWHSIELLEKEINDPKLLFLVVLDGDKIIAMCNTNYISSDIINIERLHVLSNYQGMGIGTKLIVKS